MLRRLKSSIFHWTPASPDNTILQIAKRALRHPGYRQAAKNAEEGKPIDEVLPDIIATLKTYSYRDWAAATALVEMLGNSNHTDESRRRVIDILAEVLQRKPNWDFGLRHLENPRLQKMLFVAVLYWTAWNSNSFTPILCLIAAYVSVKIVAACVLAFLFRVFGPRTSLIYTPRMDVVRAMAARSLGLLKDARALVPLSIAIKDGNMQVRIQAIKAFTEIVQAFPKTYSGALDTRTTDTLCRLIEGRDIPLALSALSILETAGDESAVHSVRWALNNSRVPDVVAATARALPALEERRSQARQRELLLRASGPVSGDVLLRAAAATQSEDPAILLRALD